jgi:endonuclease/exonuclease/phosphatase family metal-dependent hydrolase
MTGDVLRVAAWNIWWRYGPWPDREAAIRTTLHGIRPDVVTLNEVWHADSGGDQASELARDLEMHAVARYLPHVPGHRSGNAVLSRWPIVDTDSTQLTATRSVLYAQIDAPFGPLSVFTTHLSWRPEEGTKRLQELTDALTFVRARHRGPFPPILAGDLNAEPDSDELRMLHGRTAGSVPGIVFSDAWEQAGDGGRGLTRDRSNAYLAEEPWPSRRIDYILPGLPVIEPVDGWFIPLRCWVDGIGPVDGVQPSDHYAVVAELRCVRAPGAAATLATDLGADHVAG